MGLLKSREAYSPLGGRLPSRATCILALAFQTFATAGEPGCLRSSTFERASCSQAFNVDARRSWRAPFHEIGQARNNVSNFTLNPSPIQLPVATTPRLAFGQVGDLLAHGLALFPAHTAHGAILLTSGCQTETGTMAARLQSVTTA